MRFAALALVAAVGSTTLAPAAETKQPPEPDTYIFDLLALQPYRGNFLRLVKADALPEWVRAIATKGEGEAVPAKTVAIAGTPFRLDHVCKPHDCAGHTLDVLWAPAGRKVWATLVENGQPPVMLGNPPAPQAKILGDPAAAVTAAAPTPPPTTPSAKAPAAAAPAANAAAPAAPPPAPVAPEPDTYIFDVLPLQPYKGNLARLVKSKGTPDWVKAISVKGEGTAVPAKTLDVAGAPYRLDRVCKPHDCAGHVLDVLWAPGGHKVWGALVEAGKPPVMLGSPPAEQAKALADAVAAPK